MRDGTRIFANIIDHHQDQTQTQDEDYKGPKADHPPLAEKWRRHRHWNRRRRRHRVRETFCKYCRLTSKLLFAEYFGFYLHAGFVFVWTISESTRTKCFFQQHGHRNDHSIGYLSASIAKLRDLTKSVFSVHSCDRTSRSLAISITLMCCFLIYWNRWYFCWSTCRHTEYTVW